MADGARTHDNRNHNPGLYQLSYSHHRRENYSERSAAGAEPGNTLPTRRDAAQRGSLAAVDSRDATSAALSTVTL